MEKIVIKVEEKGQRLDSLVSENVDSLSRNYAQKLIKDGSILVNNNIVKTGYRVFIDDEIIINVPEAEILDIIPENIPIDIVFQDEDIIVINKQKGMVVHPSKGHLNGTLVNALLFHTKDTLSDINGITRPGIIHRIDKDTTGLLIVAKNNTSHKVLSEMIRKHEIQRIYYAIVKGIIKEEEGRIDAPIGRDKKDRKKMSVDIEGKDAITHFKVLERFEKHTYLELKLETGRTHQIRVHLSHIGYPVLGDTMYSKESKIYKTIGQTLHAGKLILEHPIKKEVMTFNADLPEYFKVILDELRNK